MSVLVVRSAVELWATPIISVAIGVQNEWVLHVSLGNFIMFVVASIGLLYRAFIWYRFGREALEFAHLIGAFFNRLVRGSCSGDPIDVEHGVDVHDMGVQCSMTESRTLANTAIRDFLVRNPMMFTKDGKAIHCFWCQALKQVEGEKIIRRSICSKGVDLVVQ